MTVRTARPQDGLRLLRLIQDHALFERGVTTISAEALDRLLRQADAPARIFVAELDRIAGYAALTLDFALWSGARYGHLDCLFVSEAYRGKGLGAALLQKVAETARAHGSVRLEWQTPEWNTEAAAFYRRHGADCMQKQRFSLAL